jgi:hypothetical protein
MALLDSLKQTRAELDAATTDYDVIVALAGFLSRLSNDPIIKSQQAKRMLRGMAFDSVGKRKAQEEKQP